MRVPQKRIAVEGLDARKLGLQCVVVGLPIQRTPLHALLDIRRCAALVQRFARKKAGGAELGVGRAGVHGRVVGRAVQVNHVARSAGRKHARAHALCKSVEAGQMPIGVLHIEGSRHITRLQFSGDVRAAVRDAQQQRGTAGVQSEAHSA